MSNNHVRPYRFHLAQNRLVSRNETIIWLYHRGIPIRKIASMHDIGRARVYEILRNPVFQTTPLDD